MRLSNCGSWNATRREKKNKKIVSLKGDILMQSFNEGTGHHKVKWKPSHGNSPLPLFGPEIGSSSEDVLGLLEVKLPKPFYRPAFLATQWLNSYHRPIGFEEGNRLGSLVQ
ncbi:hypothetical protein OUZ56_022952 [Daphnia magna]|uniref:Uncharacterized protein n=1 Tax=Daphnia magna TaxID=35525 RepID=A0ABR0AXY9_9CRUS|nr:hypothetical protein OUZ56_022952 [Daphnia magna]